LNFDEPIWNTSWHRVEERTKPKGYGSTLEEMRLNHAIISVVTATKLPLCCIIRKKNNNK